jgi:F-type H+-transporting ATPase subunit a
MLVLVQLIVLLIIFLGVLNKEAPVFRVTGYTYVVYLIFSFVKNILKDNVNSTKKYSFIFLFYFLFLVIFVSNLGGMLPYSITLTSHLFFTFYYALSFFIGINIIGVLQHNEKYFALFLPEGVPFYITPLLIPVEYISYISRVFSLSIRLFANMMSGHILLKILVGFL